MIRLFVAYSTTINKREINIRFDHTVLLTHQLRTYRSMKQPISTAIDIKTEDKRYFTTLNIAPPNVGIETCHSEYRDI